MTHHTVYGAVEQDEAFPTKSSPKVITSEIKDKDAIYGSIRDFLHQGH